MTKELILAITEHRKFGMMFIPYIITQSGGNTFYSAIERANAVNIKEVEGYSNFHEQILQIVGEYDDIFIASMFTRKKEDAVEFLKNVDQQVVNERIRPSIERRLLKIVKLLHQKPLRLFLKDRQYNKIYLSDQVEIAGPKANAVFNFNRTPEGLEYFLTISHFDKEMTLRNKKQVMLTMEPCTLVLEQKLYTFDNIDYKKLVPFFDKEFIRIPKQTEKTYFDKFVHNAVRHFKVNAKGFTIDELKPEPAPILYFQSDMSGRPCFLLKLKYDNKIIMSNTVDPLFVTLTMHHDDVVFKKLFRNPALEKDIIAKLLQSGLNTPDNVHFYTASVLSNDKQLQFYETINWMNLNRSGFDDMKMEFRQDYYDKKYLLSAISINLNINQGQDWFDVRGNVQLGGFTIAFVRLRKNLLRNIREFELPDGSIAILPAEWFEKYKELFEFGQADGESLRFSQLHFGLVDQKQQGIDASQFEKVKSLFEGKIETEIELPNGLQATLRPYQLKGYAWMRQLKRNGFGGCLADDMGLGKTLQALTLLLETSFEQVPKPTPIAEKPKAQLSLFDAPVELPQALMGKPTSLIIMPSSLVHNWLNEAEKFAPSLKVYCHVGGTRTKTMFDFNSYDVVLTTYGLIRNDADWLKHYKFHYLILDESQAIKNPDSKIYKAMMQLNSVHKLVITGTPIENSLTDLWSQMNFVNRGLLGNYTYFKNEFVNPIEKLQDAQRSKKLQGLIHPFILRRTKAEVATDLPEKTEHVHFCDMTDEQKSLYEREKSAVRNSILKNMEQNGAEKSAMMVLQALTRLRQLANHPKLLGLEHDSGKYDEVTRVLENIIAEKHKVLIFSSFVQHLQLYAQYLEANNHKYAMLTGQTKHREQVIDSFQADPDNHVFLISLKAGGVGLNLTAADYVFLLDPWWNPAAENQAINRAHRIGQDKKVFVYRFIAADSIEEKIVKLQERKSELADVFINSNNPFKALSAERIKELFD